MVCDGSCALQRERSMEQQPMLPLISDVLGDEVLPPFAPPSPLIPCSQRPNPLRSYSSPALYIDPWLPSLNQRSAICRGPTLPPMTSTKRQSAPSVHQFPSPALSTTGSSSTSSTEAGECFEPESLTSTLDQLQPDFKAVIQAARDFLEDSHIAPAFAQGWFQPENNYQRRLDSELTGLSLNDIATAFFYKDLSQALYGDRDIRPRRKPQTAAAILEDSDDLEKLEKRKAIHQKQEEDRRNRHRELQRNSHARCPEVAAKCGAEHARREKDTTRAQAGKGPGKDEQLYSSIYTQEMAGKVVQALDERRLRAEDMVRNLLQALQQVCNSFPDTWEPHQDGREAVRGNSQSRPSYVGMKRPRDNAEEEQELAWKVLVRGSEQKPGRA